jgi:hypothetical protein
MPPLVEELGPYRTIAGDRVTVTPSLGPSSSAQTPASPEPEPCRVLVTASLTNLPGLVIPENTVAVRPVSHVRSWPPRVCGRRARPLRHRRGMPGIWRFRGQPRRTSRPASRPLAGHVCRAGPSGCSCRAPPAREHRRRPGQGADIGNRVAVDDEQIGVIAGPQPALAVLKAARGRGQHGRRRQRGDGAHPAFNQESCRDGQQAVRFGRGNSGASPNIFLLSSSVRRRRRRWSQPWGPGCCWSCLLLVCWSRHRAAGRGRSVTARQIFSSAERSATRGSPTPARRPRTPRSNTSSAPGVRASRSSALRPVDLLANAGSG